MYLAGCVMNMTWDINIVTKNKRVFIPTYVPYNTYIYIYIVQYSKNFGGKKVCRIRTVGKVWQKNFGELKFICVGDVMEIVKTGKNNLENCCNSPNSLQSFTANVFYCMV